MTGTRIEDQGGGRFLLHGVLNFETIPAVLAASNGLFTNATVCDIDFADVTHSNSAGLALLVEWMRRAARNGIRIRFLNIPEQMMNIARVSSLDEILPLGAE
jgi:phospholipid transport system transporter-binding protein